MFYHSYNTPGLVYEVQAAIANLAFGFNAADGPLPRLHMEPFAGIPDAPTLASLLPTWPGRDHNSEFKRVGICCSTSLVSRDPEATPTQCFLQGYGVTCIGRPVLHALLLQVCGEGLDSRDADDLVERIAALAARHGLPEVSTWGHLLQIFVHRSCVDEIAYASLPFGIPDPSRQPLSKVLAGQGPILGQARLVANPSAFMDPGVVRLYVSCASEAFHTGRAGFQRELSELLRPLRGFPGLPRRLAPRRPPQRCKWKWPGGR